ncbi:hypothetical protein [Streptomyces coffeae]|nr:hypothetical protein [Streptomyces coffeae]
MTATAAVAVVELLACPGEHGSVTVDANDGATVTDTLRQRR